MDTTKFSCKAWKSLRDEVGCELYLGSQQDFVHAEVDMHASARNNWVSSAKVQLLLGK